jgi:hypothetical protein
MIRVFGRERASPKAPEDWRTPKRWRVGPAHGNREAFWSAAVLRRFGCRHTATGCEFSQKITLVVCETLHQAYGQRPWRLRSVESELKKYYNIKNRHLFLFST